MMTALTDTSSPELPHSLNTSFDRTGFASNFFKKRLKTHSVQYISQRTGKKILLKSCPDTWLFKNRSITRRYKLTTTLKQSSIFSSSFVYIFFSISRKMTKSNFDFILGMCIFRSYMEGYLCVRIANKIYHPNQISSPKLSIGTHFVSWIYIVAMF